MGTHVRMMFVVLFAASALGQVRTQVALVLPEGGGEAVRVVARAIGGDLDGLPVLPRGGVTAIGVVTYGDGARAWLAQTVVDNETIGDVVRVVEERAGVGTRARARGSWESGTGARAGSWEAGSLAEAMVVAGESIAASGLGGQRHVFVVLDESALGFGDALRAARDEVIGRGLADTVNAIGAWGAGDSGLDRRWLMEHVCDSRVRIPVGWSTYAPAWERSIAMAAVAPGYRASGNEYVMEEHYLDLVSIMLARCSHLLGDYDRDGAVEITFGGGSRFACTSSWIGLTPCGTDWNAFLAGVDSDPYANSDLDAVYTFNQQTGLWERSEGYDGDVAPSTVQEARNFGVDFSKFMVWMMFSKGHTCP